MSQPLPRIRLNLDFMPSPVPDRPGLLIRDPYQYSDATLIVPPPLVPCLQLFDGGHTDLDLRAELVRMTGELDVSELEHHLVGALSTAGFLEDDSYAALRDVRHREFAAAARRDPVHAGGGYPGDAAGLRSVLNGYFDACETAAADGLAAIAAPHVSPEGGRDCYAAAYRALVPSYKDRVFVVLGTSHYGEPERFGLTRKTFATPYGEARTETALVDGLEAAGGEAVHMEDYCHAVEHSIEFQVVFLQHVFGPEIRILPILCGPFAKSLYQGGKPEDHDGVNRFLNSLGDLAARENGRLLWVLGVDMAHMGRRYGDPFNALAARGKMRDVETRDRARIDRLNAGDAQGFWEAIQENHDDLKWCGSAPFYTFLRAVPSARGELLRYAQWNIDEHSVVTFAALSFRN